MKFMATVRITCDTPEAQIYYSIDGSDPSSLYSEPFELNQEATIKARAKKTGYNDSDLASFIAQKLPTPEGYIRPEGFADFYFVLTNQSSYPDNAVIVFDTDEAPVEEISVSDASEGQILYGMSCTVFARCNGYLDSESVEISEIHRE